MDDIVVARALHVLAVIHWIGGLSFVTLVVLPLARSHRMAEDALVLFESIERHFSVQVRISVPLAGATGLWMTYRMELWDRFADPNFWWMSAMFGVWLIFMIMLFVIEPLLHLKFEKSARRDPKVSIRRLSRLHEFLLLLTAVTAFGAVAGSHGLSFF
ncbi:MULTISPECIES: hypothetical protein [unclassified Rhizobium]|uniref:hypothetical protein n=1 Tax=unclassified Rhizobium TaxID=2613769 RepID=UPI0016090094|nr:MULTISPECIES: hypothetical protein [unclassified Rhizobium]MBB3289104.1 putative membrane protein [Rhizobium sp. BK252]MBB3403846.1 putative membrane protein [Rhizobium sp. BK289]MBB3416485.1 putative membrane protein [Rhizobium sp. BK284]MBB3484309.1 putative membrane protein [Rhizobium sp. BK347]